MMPRKFTDEVIDQAESMRGKGMRWIVIEACLGEGIKQACYYRKTKGYVGSYNEDLEILNAVMAWNGEGDKQSFVDGWKLRAKRERTFS